MSLTSQLSTLQQLEAGQLTPEFRQTQNLQPVTRLQIADNLTEFPKQIFALADSLEILDLSNNQLTELPDDLPCLVNLRILFLSNNQFESIPKVLAACPKLEMISFKSNGLKYIEEDVLPVDTRWLILTDNEICRLPDSMGKLHRLQKLALAGNQLTVLPDAMANCKNLELARLSANRLTSMPDWLFQLPKLSWLAFSGNDLDQKATGCDQTAAEVETAIETVRLESIELGDLIGEGASGFIYKAHWRSQPASLAATAPQVAVKIFKGSITSDGYPEDELVNCLTAGKHSSLIKVVAQLDQQDADKTSGIVMELIPSSYQNLGLPPTLETCSRDTFEAGSAFSIESIISVATQLAKGLIHLHGNGISHGDIYAHNTMINPADKVLFGDFGAATNLSSISSLQAEMMEKIEVRALGCLMDDLLTLPNSESREALTHIVQMCMQECVTLRPDFNELVGQLQSLTAKIQTERLLVRD